MENSIMAERIENDKREARNRALLCFGTKRIFEEREKFINKYNKAIKFMEFFVPLTVGAITITFSINFSLMPKYVLIIAGIFSITQLALSLWALINGYEENLKYYSDSIKINTDYSKKFEDIEKRYDEDVEKWAKELKDMIASDNILRASDEKKAVTEKEKRFGMRKGLIRFKRPCSICSRKDKELEDPKNDCLNCGM